MCLCWYREQRQLLRCHPDRYRGRGLRDLHADGRYIIAVPAENAVLSGCLGNLKELKAQGVNTLVFRTQLRETA
mgnify:FL=1